MSGADRATILTVDDDAAAREVLNEALTQLGYDVLSVDSGEAALAVADKTPPDVVLSDVHMGGMTGLELCARLKADARFRGIPFILLTAMADRSSRVAGLEAGADDFFGKPYDLIELRARLASAVRMKRLHDTLDAKHRMLHVLLGRYVSQSVADDMIAHPEQHLRLGGEKRVVTALFADLRGFTPLAETLDAEEVVHILNAYLGRAIDAVFAYGGTIDKFRGDGVMAIFGAPVAHEDDPLRAVRCALDLQAMMRELRIEAFADLDLRLGIGINTGPVVVGTIGSERRMDYTAIGNAVNIAARFEANAGPGQILITGSTYASLHGVVDVRELGSMRVKGARTAIMAYDVLRLHER